MHWDIAEPKHTGLQVSNDAPEPHLNTDAWERWDKNKWVLDQTVLLSCKSNAVSRRQWYTVTSHVQLSKYQEKTFGELEQYEFSVALADDLDVPGQCGIYQNIFF